MANLGVFGNQRAASFTLQQKPPLAARFAEKRPLE
jgi:hypothetical protein